MTTKIKIIICVFIFLLGILVGGFLNPNKSIRSKDEIKNNEELERKSDENTRTNEEIIEEINKDGSKKIKTKRETVVVKNTEEFSQKDTTIKKEKEIKYGSSGAAIIPMFDKNFQFRSLSLQVDTKVFKLVYDIHLVALFNYDFKKPIDFTYGIGIMVRY